MPSPAALTLAGLLGLLALVLGASSLSSLGGAHLASADGVDGGQPFLGTTNDPQVHVAVDLHDVHLQPSQLAYDTQRGGLWFWTSTITHDQPTNRLYFYDAKTAALRTWPIYSGDWSAQMLAGLAVAPNGDIWIGWNHNLCLFHPATGASTRFVLPAQIAYPLPRGAVQDMLADLDTFDLGISDLTVDAGGMVWLARFGAVSLTSFSPQTGTFTEHPLPAAAGDPAKLRLGPNGHLFFTTNRSTQHPGRIAEHLGEYDPATGGTTLMEHSATALAVTPSGDLYFASLGGRQQQGLARVTSGERAAAASERRGVRFELGLMPFGVNDEALAADPRGRVWMTVSGQPKLAVFDPATGQTRQFQYAAPSWAARLAHSSTAPSLSAAASRVVLIPIRELVADDQGRAWYVRAGTDKIEVVQG